MSEQISNTTRPPSPADRVRDGSSFPLAYLAARFPARSETFVYREVRALRERGWAVHAITLNDPAEPGQASFADLERGLLRVYGAGKRQTLAAALAEAFLHPLRSLGTMLLATGDAIVPGEKASLADRAKGIAQAIAGVGLARRLRKAGVRHLHCHFAHAPSGVGMYAARQAGIPFSFTGHANDLFQRRALLRRKLSRAAFVACISEWHRAFYRALAPERAGEPGKYPVIRCGVDISAWRPVPMKESGGAAVSGFPVQVLTLCRLVEKKGVDTLLRACDEMGKRLARPWKLTVAGDGPDRARLQSLAAELGCADHVRWLGAVDNESVPALLAAADVFALPCRTDSSGDRDGIPVVLMEAMACGVPVISGDLEAIRELIRDGESGFLINGADVDGLAARIASIAASHDLRGLLIAAGRRRIESEFSLETNVARLERAIDLAAARQGGGAERLAAADRASIGQGQIGADPLSSKGTSCKPL